MTPDALPVALSRLTEAVEDVKAAMERTSDFDDLWAIHLELLPLTAELMHTDDLARARAEAMIGKRS